MYPHPPVIYANASVWWLRLSCTITKVSLFRKSKDVSYSRRCWSAVVFAGRSLSGSHASHVRCFLPCQEHAVSGPVIRGIRSAASSETGGLQAGEDGRRSDADFSVRGSAGGLIMSCHAASATDCHWRRIPNGTASSSLR